MIGMRRQRISLGSVYGLSLTWLYLYQSTKRCIMEERKQRVEAVASDFLIYDGALSYKRGELEAVRVSTTRGNCG